MVNISLSDASSSKGRIGGLFMTASEFVSKAGRYLASVFLRRNLSFAAIRDLIEERPVIALGLFLVAFACPVLLVWGLSGAPTTNVSYFAELEQHSKKLESSGSRLTFGGSETLNPPETKDLIVFSTWKIHLIPSPGERTVLLTKTTVGGRGDASRVKGEGFALGLINDAGSLRFMLSWPGADGARWMRFGEVHLVPDQWFLIAISVRNRQAVGAFFVPLSGARDRPRVQTLGGFSVAGFPADSAEPLTIAPQGSARFMSRVGPVGVLRGTSLGGRETEILREIASDPVVPPDSVSQNQVALFWSGGPMAIGSGGNEFPVL